MKKQFKMVVTLLLTVCLIAVPLIPASAATPEEISPCFNNTSLGTIRANISTSGLMTISYLLTGYQDVTTKIVVTTYIEKKTLGLFWTRVDNGQPNKQWVDTIYDFWYGGSRTYQLSSKGTYRTIAVYKVYGSGGTADEITCKVENKY